MSARARSAVVLAIVWCASSARGELAPSRHNLSVTGLYSVRAVTEEQRCVFCHGPHFNEASLGLWNHVESVAVQVPYASASLQATPGAPLLGPSRMCASCHDGTVPIGQVKNLEEVPALIAMQGANADGTMPPGRTLLGTDFRNDHPVDFPYTGALTDGDRELADAGTVTGGLIRRGAVHCSSCHDPHGTEHEKFLRQPWQDGVLCLKCHVKPGWSGSTHQASTTVFAAQGSQQVKTLACMGCHQPHGAPEGAPRLLRDGAILGGAAIQQTCYRCHQPPAQGGIAPDVKSQFAKPYRHPVGEYPGHQPVFTVATPPEGSLNTSRHVECPDCHNPHRVTPRNKHDGMRGMQLDGGVADDVTQERDLFQYEICLRCHGDTVAQVVANPLDGGTASGLPPSDKRREFQVTNSAFHPVSGPGRNTSLNLASQLQAAGLTPRDTIQCSDCHNSDETGTVRGRVSNAVGNGALGPHGSTNKSILRANFWSTYKREEGPTSFSADNFALCFLCHEQNRLLAQNWSSGARTNFYNTQVVWLYGAEGVNLHWLHLVRNQARTGATNVRATCKNCHFNVHSNVKAPNTMYTLTYPNGVELERFETPLEDVPTHLVNFSPDLVPYPNEPGNKPHWGYLVGGGRRDCYVTCHGRTMMGGLWSYDPPEGDHPY